MIYRTPSADDYAAYRGEHCFSLWRRVGPTWNCPACNRTRFEIMRWTRRQARPSIGILVPFMGWMAGLHTHHDHNSPAWTFDGRFPPTVICDQCNAADGAAKRQLQLPGNFSFSPAEIGRFVIANPHQSHRLNLDIAYHIFRGNWEVQHACEH